MNHIQTLETRDLAASLNNGGCGECQTSCQSACKTSCGVANQQCENKNCFLVGRSLNFQKCRAVKSAARRFCV